MFFAISALRALVEMLLLCLIARGVLGLVAGTRREANVIYRFFDLLTAPPRQTLAFVIQRPADSRLVVALTAAILLSIWLLLAFLRLKL